MGKALVATVNNSGGSMASASRVGPAGAAFASGFTEANQNFKVGIAGTFSLLGANINVTGTTRAIRFRKNNADGNQTASIADAGTGLFEDAVNTDTVAVGDNINVNTTEAGTNPTYFNIRTVFTATTGHACFYGIADTGTSYAASTTFYNKFCGNVRATTAESSAQLTVRAAGTASYLTIIISTNGSTDNNTVRSRLNTANGGMSITVGPGVTGVLTDTSGTDTLASGNLFCGQIVTGNGGITITTEGYSFASSAANNDLCTDNVGGARTASATQHFFGITGRNVSSSNTTESQAQVRHGFAVTVSKLRANIITNGYTGTSTIVSRVNGANGNQTISLGAGVTGIVEDTTNSDVLTSTSDYCIGWSGGTANTCNAVWFAVLDTVPSTFIAAPPKVINQAVNRAASW